MGVLRNAAFLTAVGGTAASRAGRANPVRKVVDMLEGMQDKTRKEGEEATKMFDEAMCFCKNTANDLKRSIQAAQTKIPQVTSSLEEGREEHKQLGQDLRKAKATRSEAEAAIQEATSLRKKEADAYAKKSGDFKTNIAALGKAIAAVEGGSASSFLQTSGAEILQQITVDAEMNSTDRDAVSAFLSQEQSAGEEDSGEIVGILKQLKETMEGNSADETATEQKAIQDFNTLVATRQQEILDASAEIESKLAREGEVGEHIVMIKEDLEDTSAALPKDQKALADLGKACAQKEADFEEKKSMRTQEIVAIADTIKILTSDEALELMKKTLPSASFLQVAVSSKQMVNQAMSVLGAHQNPRLEFIALSLRGGSSNFDKVLAMIDSMMALLKEEQVADDKKKAYCEKEFDTTEDDKKVLVQTKDDIENAIEDAKQGIATVTDELAALADGIHKLDSEVFEATQMREKEHAAYEETTASNTAAKELLGMASNRMKKTFQAGFVQMSASKASGVLEMLNGMIGDLDKQLQVAKVDEDNAQASYEQFMSDGTDKRAQDVQTITDKEGAKAELDAALEQNTKEHRDTKMAIMSKEEEIMNLHKDCDWSLQNFDARKQARAGEGDSLKKAKAILSGADYSFLQVASHGQRAALRR